MILQKILDPLKNAYSILLKKNNLELIYNKDSKELLLNSTEKITLRLGGNFHLVIDGDYDTSVNGEYNLITNGKNIHMDSVGASVHLNSRLSKQIKNLPENIELREKNKDMLEDSHLCKCDGEDNEMDRLFNDILDLFQRVEKLENKGHDHARGV